MLLSVYYAECRGAVTIPPTILFIGKMSSWLYGLAPDKASFSFISNWLGLSYKFFTCATLGVNKVIHSAQKKSSLVLITSILQLFTGYKNYNKMYKHCINQYTVFNQV
jgi:hypothetical protein